MRKYQVPISFWMQNDTIPEQIQLNKKKNKIEK